MGVRKKEKKRNALSVKGGKKRERRERFCYLERSWAGNAARSLTLTWSRGCHVHYAIIMAPEGESRAALLAGLGHDNVNHPFE